MTFTRTKNIFKPNIVHIIRIISLIKYSRIYFADVHIKKRMTFLILSPNVHSRKEFLSATADVYGKTKAIYAEIHMDMEYVFWY